MSFESQSSPVLVAGAGPAGLAAALELTRLGRAVRIIEEQDVPSTHSKAIGINARTLELLEPSGVTERLLERGRRLSGMKFFEKEQVIVHIELSQLRHRFNFMLALPQSETESILEARLHELGVTVERKTALTGLEISPDAARCTLNTKGAASVEEFPILIGADGAHSTVRDELGIDFAGEQMPGDWSLADVRMETSLEGNTANIFIDPRGMIFMLRFKENIHRLASNKPRVLDRLPAGWKVSEVLWESTFNVSHRQAASYREGRAFLVGDAAHIHSPLGGRGMNMGIEDATLLARRIVEGNLEGFADSRHKATGKVVRMVKAQTNLATGTGFFSDLTRRRLLPAILKFPPLRQNLLRRLAGLKL